MATSRLALQQIKGLDPDGGPFVHDGAPENRNRNPDLREWGAKMTRAGLVRSRRNLPVLGAYKLPSRRSLECASLLASLPSGQPALP